MLGIAIQNAAITIFATPRLLSASRVANIDVMTATEVPSFAASTASETPSSEAVASGTNPLADGFRSRFFTEDDYRQFHARAAPNTDAVFEPIGAAALGNA
jgi:hypothetical protein